MNTPRTVYALSGTEIRVNPVVSYLAWTLIIAGVAAVFIATLLPRQRGD